MIDQSNACSVTAELPKSVMESEKYISQQDALISAAQSIVLLGLETPEKLSKQYSFKCNFSFAEFYDLYVWHIDMYIWQNGRRLDLYSIQVDAASGQLFSIHLAPFMHTMPTMTMMFQNFPSNIGSKLRQSMHSLITGIHCTLSPLCIHPRYNVERSKAIHCQGLRT